MIEDIQIKQISKLHLIFGKWKHGSHANISDVVSRLPRKYFIVIMDGLEVGIISLRDIRINIGLAEITISIYSKYRNHGIGSTAISLLKTEAKRVGIKTLIAYVQTNNIHSLKIFQKNGFFESATVPIESIQGNLKLLWSSTKCSEEILFQNEHMQLPLHLNGFGMNKLSDLSFAILTKEGNLYDWLINTKNDIYREGGIYLGKRIIDNESIIYLSNLLGKEFDLGTRYLIISKENLSQNLLYEITIKYPINIVFTETIIENIHNSNRNILTSIRRVLKLKVIYDLEVRKCL